MASYPAYLNYIDGRWCAAASGKTFESRSPADDSVVIGTAPLSSAEDVDAAARAASAAFGSWRLTPAPVRAGILLRVARLIEERKQELGTLLTREMGKVLPEALGDVQEAVDMGFYMAGEGRRMFGQTTHSELPDKDMKSVREPVGVFGIITPWNFPIAIPGWKVFPCLVAGNTAVLKPSSDTPVLAAQFVRAFHDAGLPAGALNLVCGTGSEVGDALVRHPLVSGISFTGSCEVGFGLEALCGQLHKRITAEMGGKNAILVMDDADLELAVDGTVWGAFGTSGQRCTAASRVILHKAVKEKFTEMLLKRVRSLRLGDGLLPATDVGPVINEASLRKIHSYVELGRKEGATLLAGGKQYKGKGCERGWFYEPTVFAGATERMRISQEEIFGPVLALMECSSLKDGIRLVNSTSFGLSSAIYTRDVNSSAVAERDIQSGIVYINASTIGSEVHLPFGGIKSTGLGPKEAGGMGGAIDFFTRVKVVYRDYSGRLQRAQLDTEELAKEKGAAGKQEKKAKR